MRLVISEKNIAARRIAEILSVGKPKADKVYTTPVYRFRRDGEDWVSIGLRGHIMKVDFPPEFSKWSLEGLKDLSKADVLKLPSEKGIIRSIQNLAKKSDHVVIATDYDREGELIGADARELVLEVNRDVPVTRARFSAITRGEVEKAFSELGEISDDLAEAGATRQDIDLIWGAVLTRFLTVASNKAAKIAWGSVRSAGRVQTPTLKLIVERELERDAFVPEDYWTVKASFGEEGEEFENATYGQDIDNLEDARDVLSASFGPGAWNVTVEGKESRRKHRVSTVGGAASSPSILPGTTGASMTVFGMPMSSWQLKIEYQARNSWHEAYVHKVKEGEDNYLVRSENSTDRDMDDLAVRVQRVQTGAAKKTS